LNKNQIHTSPANPPRPAASPTTIACLSSSIVVLKAKKLSIVSSYAKKHHFKKSKRFFSLPFFIRKVETTPVLLLLPLNTYMLMNQLE
jgi:hypothetical protein